MAKVYTFNPILHRILIFLINTVFRFRFPLKITNPEVLKEMKPPFILLPNHTMKWDVIVIGIAINQPIHFMSTDAHFRSPKIGALLKKVGTFPKAKAMNDLSAIRHMMSLKEQKKIVCIFPEGQMTWDGNSLPPFASTAKLLKLMKVPVYMPVVKGAYAIRPRWSISRRKGPMEMTIKKLETDGKAFKQQTPEEIYEKMRAIIQGNEYEEIRKQGWEYSSPKRAEYLENFLFICPECSSLAKLESNGNTFTCTDCGSSREIDGQYRFHPVAGTPAGSQPQTADPGTWNEWQKIKLAEMLEAYRSSENGTPFLTDSNVTFQTGYRQDPPVLWSENGEMELYRDHILLKTGEGESRKILFSEITGAHVLMRNRFEFYHNKTLYMFGFPDQRISGYKWLSAVKLLGVPSSYVWGSDEVQDS